MVPVGKAPGKHLLQSPLQSSNWSQAILLYFQALPMWLQSSSACPFNEGWGDICIVTCELFRNGNISVAIYFIYFLHYSLLIHQVGIWWWWRKKKGVKGKKRKGKKIAKEFLTSGGARYASTSLSKTGAIHHHPSLVWLLPSLPNNIGCSRRVVIATLSWKKKKLILFFSTYQTSKPSFVSQRCLSDSPTGLQVHSPLPLPRQTHSSM